MGRRGEDRRKNGDFYWVLASATPIWEGGQVAGYMSIRTKLPADQREEAERVYALSAQTRRRPTLAAGVVRRRSLRDRLALFTGTLKARLVTLMAVQAAFMVIVGVAGILATRDSNTQLKSVYKDRAVPLAQLFDINDRMKGNTIALYVRLRSRAPASRPGTSPASSSSNVEAISETWAE